MAANKYTRESALTQETVSSITAGLGSAFNTYMSELEAAGPHWERKPEGSAEGEAAWSARQVAEHIASTEPFFATRIAAAFGITAPEVVPGSFDTSEKAVASTNVSHQALVSVVSSLSDEQLAQEIEIGPLGRRPMTGVLGMAIHHLNDHANQLKSLRENA